MKADEPHFSSCSSALCWRFKLIVNLLPHRANIGTEGEGDGAYATALTLFAPGAPRRKGWDSFARPGAEEFYDLQADPGEWNNLSGQASVAGEQKRLRGALQAWRENLKDPFLDATFLAAQEKLHFEKLDKNPKAYTDFVQKQRNTALPSVLPAE